MSDLARTEPTLPNGTVDLRPDPVIRVAPANTYFDLTSVVGIFLSLSLIAVAIAMGNGANFLDIPSVLIVILGTTFATSTAYTGRELRLALPKINGSFIRRVFEPRQVAKEILDLAILARKRGILSLGVYASEIRNNPDMYTATQMVADGLSAAEVDRMINQDMDITMDGYRKAAGILRRASEIAPAMGLIGTLVGLVQMLVALDNPSAIGPAMAVALLTTFYGAIMGSVVLSPLAAKLERNAAEDNLVKSLIHVGMLAIISQENPRKLEMELNSLLPPDLRIAYFDL